MKTKIKSHGYEATDFYDKKALKVDSNHSCLVVISLDSGLKKDENYYSEIFWNECKYIKVVRHDLENSSDDSDEE